jgi:type II secretory pathway pseudopilin PulG
MQYIFIASLLTAAVYAAPFAQQAQQQGQQQQGAQQQGQQQQGAAPASLGGNNAPATGTGAGVANGQTPSANDLATAVSNWQADTSMVSNFLNTGASIQNNVQFKPPPLLSTLRLTN